jgi:2-amino-4-hydroxy-6-hydroxymethyldihydropteridine diphosphokinase
MKAYLGLGSNLGNRFRNLSDAVNHLVRKNGIRIAHVSPVYETDPVGNTDQPKYLNAVLEIDTVLEPMNLLKTCLEVEAEMGRIRTRRWESRSIDIDVLLCGEELISTEELIVPHPLLHEREFVLRPLADIAPDLVHPVLDESIAELLCQVEESGVRKMEDLVLTVAASRER